jgi:hypothetical protein
MKLKLVGNILMVTSAIKEDAFTQAEQVDANASYSEDEEGNTLFKINFDSSVAAPKFQKFACTFNQTDESGFMQAAILLSPQNSKEDYNNAIVDKYGVSLNALANAEKDINANVTAVNKTMNDLLETIE